MNHLSKSITVLALCCCTTLKAQAQLIINELMQSNIDCIMDDINEFPDSWVEIYNSSSAAINLNLFQLGNSNDPNTAWQLPNKVINAHDYVLIYCDKEATGLHTNFRLESGKGCEVYLFRNKQMIDQVSGLKKQPAPNIAYGRETEGATTWGYQYTPTPGAANCKQLCTEILGEPLFSQKGCVMTTSQTLWVTLSVPDGSPTGTEIRYTLDGTEPTKNSILYRAPLSFSSTAKVRAKLFCNGYLSPRATTHSYIFFPSSRQLTLPVISIVTNNRYLNDTKIGIYVDGSYQNGKKNYEFDWRRPINIELFEGANQESVINQLCETRIMGGATRSAKMKSLAVYANKRFGTKRLEYEFFPDQHPGITDFKSIALRNAGNDFDYLYMRDAIIQRTMAQHTDLDWQAWCPAIVYINGTYKGILNIRDRSNDDNVYTYYDGLEDIDMIENWNELKEGDWDNYNKFTAFYAEHGHTMAEYEQWMDCIEYINLMAMNLYYNNQDFPGNNIVMWRPKAEGGRWRWIAKDTDFGLGLYGSSANYKTFEWLYNPNFDYERAWANQYEHTRLFRRLMEDADFQREFIDRTAIYMGDFLNERGTRAIWDPMYNLVKTEYPSHRALINMWWPNYNDELNSARSWLNQRTSYFYKQLADFYKLGSPTPLIINKSASEPVETTINGVHISGNYFDGKFFANRQLTVEATAAEGREVKGWKVTRVNGNSTTNSEVNTPQYTFNMPACTSLTLTAIVGEASGISNLMADEEWQTPDAIYDLQGHRVTTPTKGIYIFRKGNKTRKIVIK